MDRSDTPSADEVSPIAAVVPSVDNVANHQEEAIDVIEPLPNESTPVESTAKKRKAEEMVELDAQPVVENNDDAITCNICFEPWSNTGSHRIASLKCGHFFGLACIEKWLNSTGGNDCPTCNEKATKRDIRRHYVARLQAIDTADRDRALQKVDALSKELRALELEHATLKVTNHLQRQEIEALNNQIKSLRENCPPVDSRNPLPSTSSSTKTVGNNDTKLSYVKRLELLRPDGVGGASDKACRVMAYNETHGMLVVSQPSFTALAPGFGVRRVQMLAKKLDSFVSLHKEAIRDMAFNPVRQDQLLSVSQDKTARLTNISSCSEIQRYNCDSEAWSCCWNPDEPHVFFVGTKRSRILVFDTRDPTGHKAVLEFPVEERRPIIGLAYAPRCPDHPGFPFAGLFVVTLGSLWFFERTSDSEYKAHKLPVDGLFWCLRFDLSTRLLLVSTRPTPHARHVVVEVGKVDADGSSSVIARTLFDNKRGGSFKGRSFLRSNFCPRPSCESQALVAFGRGSGTADHKLVVQEIGSEKVIQELFIQRPIVDVCSFSLNSEDVVCVLTESDLHMYKWTTMKS